MTIPTEGTITSEMVRAEWGLTYPLTSAAVAAAANLPFPLSSDQLRGKSAFAVDFTVGDLETVPAGGTARRVTRLLTAVVAGGVGPFVYAWSLDAATERNGFYGVTNTITARVGQSYDLGSGEILVGETSQVTLTVTDQGAGRTLSAVHAVNIH